jgi:tRNA A37 threonylcarbamoyladenosine modification protein TsaB
MAANAAGGGNGSRLVATLLDARQGFLYGALFEVNERGVERLLPDQVAALPDLAAAFARRLDDLGRDRVLACGDGADLFLERLARLDGQKPTFERGPGAWDVPRAGRLASLAWPALQGTSGAPFDPEAVHRLEPAYLRPTDAERKRALAARDA